MKKNTGYKIWTNDGWKDFDGIRKSESEKLYHFTFDDGSELECTADHLIFYDEMYGMEASSYSVGDEVYSATGNRKISKIDIIEEKKPVYDILQVGDMNKFFANDILVHNCEFIGRQGTLIESTILRELINKTKDTTYEYLIDNNIRFYKELEIDKKYLVALDPSIGVENDFAAIQMFELPTWKQVAEWKDDKLNQNDQVEKLNTLITYTYKKLKELGCRSPEIYWTFENNACGEGIIVALREKAQAKGYEYPQDYIRRGHLISQIGNKRLGFTTDKRTKNLGCSRLKIMIETHKIDILSKETVLELTNFTSNQVSYASSKSDEHDDLVMAMVVLINMYLQEKNKLDLNQNINVDKKPVIEDDKYDIPFLFTMN